MLGHVYKGITEILVLKMYGRYHEYIVIKMKKKKDE